MTKLKIQMRKMYKRNIKTSSSMINNGEKIIVFFLHKIICFINYYKVFILR